MCSLIIRGYQVLCDEDDLEMLKNCILCVSKRYKQLYYGGKLLTRVLMKVTDSNVFVDHINGNELDNRRCNLRLVTIQQNSQNHKLFKNNTSGFTGVIKEKKTLKDNVYYTWKALIGSPSGPNKSSYYQHKKFKSLHDAITWRYNKEIEIFGEYSRMCNKKSLNEILSEIENVIFEDGRDIRIKCSKCSKEFRKCNITRHEKICG